MPLGVHGGWGLITALTAFLSRGPGVHGAGPPPPHRPHAAAVFNILFIPVQCIFVSGFKWSAPQSIRYCPRIGTGQPFKDTS